MRLQLRLVAQAEGIDASTITITDKEEDRRGVDARLPDGTAVAMRVRHSPRFCGRDLTVRQRPDAQGISERDKLISGAVQAYLTVWTHDGRRATGAVYVDAAAIAAALKLGAGRSIYRPGPEGHDFLVLGMLGLIRRHPDAIIRCWGCGCWGISAD